MANILAVGVNDGESSDVVVANGAYATVTMIGAPGAALTTNTLALVKINSNGSRTQVGSLNAQVPSVNIRGEGTYKVVRAGSAVATGADLG